MTKSKKRLTILMVGASVTVLAVIGAFAGIISAQTPSGESTESPSLFDRVGTILGKTGEEVESAFAQAKEQMHQERLDAKLAQLVTDGVITQAESDEIKAWIESEPDITINEEAFEGKRGHSGKGKGIHGRFIGKMIGAGSDGKFDWMVEQGIISQADGDALKAWHEAKPDALDKIAPDRDGDGKKGKRGFGKGCDKDGKYDKDRDKDDKDGASADKASES